MALPWSKIRVPKLVWASLLAFAAGGFWGFMVAIDEIYTLGRYCGPSCLYPYPWTVPLDGYLALTYAFIYIGVCWFVSMVAFHKVLEK